VVGRQKPAHHQEYCSDIFWVLRSMSRLICMIFVAGLMHVGSIVLWHVEGFAVSMLQV